ncbi:autotransporter-associated beta strand repeat-containing protein [Ideonella alba]|uniref:Autotransporter-associated beta strand repeat-containing protein n=1 Tax=Ideonella alba TaxID=2824118 RepID=A0A940Y4S7_9BURK|nr:autotransporter-associated beta strand repeat-containing protein [Ideonella alba]MBQ0929782.1 autotransporter-associated beta strand repeat-containing protein [Ideonella alba]
MRHHHRPASAARASHGSAGTTPRLRPTAWAAAWLLAGALQPAQAAPLPTGARVVAGQVQVGTAQAGTLTLQQTSDRAIVNWLQFDIGADQQVRIVQPGAGAALLNRVTGDTPSTLAGRLQADGQVFLVNPNGISVSPGGRLQATGLVLSTLDISDTDFLANRLVFRGLGDSATVTQAGQIQVAPGGFAALLGGRVSNSGQIQVPMGRVGLGAGEHLTLDLGGNGFLQVAVPSRSALGAALIEHSGQISADGGLVQMQAAAAREAARQAVNLSGVVEARTVSGRAGAIELGGGDGAVWVGGRLDASGPSQQGGQITVTGREIALQGATLDASGAHGGGRIRVGGERQGGGTLPRAQNTTVDSATTLNADARTQGNGGEVVVWADGRTDFAGRISARGAGASGHGGDAEVSGRTQLRYVGQTDLRAADDARSGRTGTLLLDPYDVTISSAADSGAGFSASANDTVINTTTLQNALATANVTVSTGSGGTQSGQITVASALNWSANTTLTLDAAAGVAVNAAITNTGAGSGLTLQAAGSAGITGTGALANSGSLSFNQHNAAANSSYAGAISGTGSVTKAGSGILSLTGTNSYSGLTSVSEGTLQLSGTGKLGSGSINLSSGATLLFNTSAHNNSGTLLSNSISGAGTLQVAGAAATQLVRMSGSLSGLTGTLQVDTGARANLESTNLGSATAAFVVNGLLATQTTGATYQLGSLAGSGTVSQGGGTTNTVLEIGANGQSTTFSGNIGNCCDSTSVKKLGTGTWTLTGAQTYTGSTTISAGTLQVGAGGTSGALNGSSIVNNAALVYNRSDNVSIGNAISGSGSLTQSGSGTLTLTGSNTYSGTTTINAGTLQVGAGSTTGTLGSGSVINHGTLSVNRSNALTVANAISGTGALTKSGAGTLTLTGANTYSGATAVTSGTVKAGSTGAFSAASAFTTSSGVVVDLAGYDNSMGSLSGSGTLTNNGAAVATLTMGGNNASTTFAGVMQDGSAAFALAKTGSGTLALSGTNTFTGLTTISGGTLQFGDGGSFGKLGSGNVLNNSVLAFDRTVSLTVSNAISGTGSLVKNNSNTITLAGSNSYTGTTTISAGTLQVGSGGTSGTLGTGSVSNDAALVFNRSDALTVGADIGGSGTLTKSGAGTLTLTGTNTYAGTTTINAGTLQVGQGGTAGTLGSGAVANSGALVFNRSDAMSVAGAISGSGSLTQAGSGTLSLSGASSYSGSTTVTQGTLRLTGSGRLGAGSYSGLSVAGGSLFEFASSAAQTLSSISGAGTLTHSGSGTLTLSGTPSFTGIYNLNGPTVISGASNLAKAGLGYASAVNIGGYVTLAGGNNSFLGYQSDASATTVVTLNAGGTLYNPGATIHLTNGITFNGGTLASGPTNSTFTTYGSYTFDKAVTVTANSTASALNLALNAGGSGVDVVVSPGATLTVSGTIDRPTFGGGADLRLLGGGTLLLQSANSFTGATTVTQGTLRLTGSGQLGAGSYSSLSVASGALFEYASSAAQTLSSISGAGTLTHSGAGTLTLSGTPSFTGIYNLNGPTVISGAANLAKAGLGYASAVNIGGYVTLAGGDNSFLGYLGDSTATTVVTLNPGGTLYNPGTTIHLTNGITFNGGTLASGPTNSTFTTYGSYTFDKAVTVTASSTASAVNMALNSGSGVDVVVSPGATLTVSGSIDHVTNGGGASLRLLGGGTLLLQSANSFTGATTVSAGTLKLGHAGALASSSAVTVDGTLDLNGQAPSIASLAGSGTVTNSGASAATLTAGDGGASTTFSGVIQDGAGSVALTKTGSGTLTLSGAHSYSGATTVDGGTLALSGSWDRSGATATVAVAAGATLSGAGTLSASTLQVSGAGSVHLSGSNAIHQLGTSGTVGTLSLNNAASLAVGAITSTGPITVSTSGGHADLTLTQALHSDASGDAVVLSAGGRFINQAGASAITTGAGGRFLVYSNDWEADTVGGLSAGHLYHRSYASHGPGTITQSGSQLVYSRQPILTVTAQDASRVYGDANPLLSASLTGLVNGDSAAAAYSGSAALGTSASALSGVGDYTITASAGSLASAQGYGFVYVPGTLAVTPRPITISAQSASRIYGNANPALGYTVGGLGLVNGDGLTGALATAATSGSDVGSYAITQGSLAASPNYALSFSGSQLAVTPRTIIVSAAAQSRTYGEANPTLGYSIGGLGLVGGDALTGSLTTTADLRSHVGTYAIEQGSLTASANYSLQFEGSALQVTPRTLTISAAPVLKPRGTALDPAQIQPVVSGLASFDQIASIDWQSPGAGPASAAGRYALSAVGVSGIPLQDYRLVTPATVLEVQADPASTTISPALAGGGCDAWSRAGERRAGGCTLGGGAAH